MYERRRITEFLLRRKTIGGKTRRFGFVTIIQERKWEGWEDIAWDDYDTPRDLSSYPDETLPVPETPTYPIEHQGWGEGRVAQGAYTTVRETPARQCAFAVWKVDGSDHQGFARVYGKGNAQRIVDTLTACVGMVDPIGEVARLKNLQHNVEVPVAKSGKIVEYPFRETRVGEEVTVEIDWDKGTLVSHKSPSTALKALQELRAEEVAAALLQLSETRPGLAYDVGMALYKADAGKEVPGAPWGWFPASDSDCRLEFVGYDRSRRVAALWELRKLLKLPLKEAKAVLDTLDNGHGFTKEYATWCPTGDLTELRACGFDVQLVSSEEGPPASHRVSLRDLSRGPC